jgi:SAM-dependent methyltransferase
MELIAGRPSPVFERARRSAQTEVLDGPVDPGALADILRDLARFNGAMLGRWLVLQWLGRALGSVPRNQPLTLLDIGCGYGDLLRTVRRWARKHGRRITLIGVDLSPQVIDVARNATDAADAIDYQAADIFTFKPASPIDFISASLVTHHLSNAKIVQLLRWMEAHARKGWVIYDLQRSRAPFFFIALAGVLMRLHAVVTYDGRISVARSLTRDEWRQRLAEAGIAAEEVDLRWFMFRFTIGRMK